MPEKQTTFLRCPRCGGKTRTQVRYNTVLIEFPLFCPKCRYESIIWYEKGKLAEKTPDAKTQCGSS